MDTLKTLNIQQPPYEVDWVYQFPNPTHPNAPQTSVYLLLDGAQINALQLIYSNQQPPELDVLYHNTLLQDLWDISPVMVRLDNNTELQKKYAQWQPYAIAFTSTADLKTTAKHLKSLLLCTMPNTQPALFRFYAHNWLHPLLTELDQETLSAFTGPIDNWYIPMPEKKWQRITVAVQGEAKTEQDIRWFILTEKIQTALSKHSFQHYIDELTTEITFEPLDSEEGQIQRAKVLTRINKAQDVGLEIRSHISQYVMLAYEYPTQIDDPQASAILNQEEIPRLKLDQLERYLKSYAQLPPDDQPLLIPDQPAQQGTVQ